MKVSVAQLEEAKETIERMDRRLKKDRAKLRKLKRSLGITKRAKIQGQQMVSGAGSKSGSAGLLKEEGSAGSKEEVSAGSLKEEGSQKTKATKIVRLSQETNGIVLARSIPPHPRIPSWKLAMESEYTQELYKKSLALAEMLEKEHEDMYKQVFRKGYFEMEVSDDEDNTEE